MYSVVLLDPTSLHGQHVREIWTTYAPADMQVVLLHTRDSEEHQITEIDDAPAMVPSLEKVADLSGAQAVVITTAPGDTAHQVLRDWIASEADAVVIDLTQGIAAVPGARIIAGQLPSTGTLRFQLAHPAVIAVHELLEPLADLGPERISLTVIEPVSVFGASGVEQLAEQSVGRLRGETSPRGFGGTVLAFNHVAVDGGPLTRDLAAVLPDLQSTASRCLSGSFHGVVAHLTVTSGEALSPETLTRIWSEHPGVELSNPCSQFDAVGQDQIRVGPATHSEDGLSFAVTFMVDGLMVGGAKAVVTLLKEAAARRADRS